MTESTYIVKAHDYGGGFCGLERDAEVSGLLDGLGIDISTATSEILEHWAEEMSATIEAIRPQSIIIDSKIYNCTYNVTGTDCLGGFVGAMTSSYAVDCTVDCAQNPITVQGSEYAGGFAGYASVGWQSSLGNNENAGSSLLGTVKELAIGLLSSDDKSAGQDLLTLMGVSPSAVLGCQVYSSQLEIEADKSFAGGLAGKGEGIYLCKSDQVAYDEIADWNAGYEVDEFTAAGFIADSNSTKITDSHYYNLLSVTAADDYGYAGAFVGTSETGGLADVADNDATSIKKLINANGLVRAIEYLIPEYTNCTANFVNGGYVDADIAGGFAANFPSGTVDNSTIATVDDAQEPKWTRTMKEMYDPNAVINIDHVHGRTYGGGFGGKLISGALASAGGGLSILGNNDLGLELDISKLASVINAYIPYVKHAGSAAGTGCNVTNLRYVKGANAVGGFVGTVKAANVADVNTNSSNGLLQAVLNGLVSTPGDLASVMQATIATVRQAAVSPDNSSFGFTVGGTGNIKPHFAGGFVGLADVGSVASVSGTGDQQTTILGLINAGRVDLLDAFRTYIYHSDVNGVAEGMIIRAYESAPEGILSETRQSGCGGGFGGCIMNGTVTYSGVTNLNTVYAPNYTGGFIGHMGKNGAVDVDKAQIPLLANLDAGAIDVFGTTVNECSASGIDAGSVIMATGGAEPISGGFAGYADDAQIKNSNVTKLKQVYSDQIAGGFVGKTNMSYLVSAEVDSPTVQLVLIIVNALVKALYVDKLENVDLIDFDSRLAGLRLFAEGDLLYVNLLGLRIGVSLVKSTGQGETDTALITIGDSTIALPCSESGIDMNGENAEAVINLIKTNRTRVENCSVTGIDIGYDVYGGGASNTADGSNSNGYAGGFVGYNNEGKFTSDTMAYCDVVRGTAQKVGPFSGGTKLDSVYSFNTLESIEKVDGEENHYSVYRKTSRTYALTAGDQPIGAQAVTDNGYRRFTVTHLAAPITPGKNEAYYLIFKKWENAKLVSKAGDADSKPIDVYANSGAKAVLMLDKPTELNVKSLVPNPGESKDPCEDTMKLTVQKIWKDHDNSFGARPDSISVRIIQHKFTTDGNGHPDMTLETTTPYLGVSDADENGWFTLTQNDHERNDSSTWTRVIDGLPVYTSNPDAYYSYTVEEKAVRGYTTAISYDETEPTSVATTATIVNTKAIEIQFKYYDRYEIDGKTAGIRSDETKYSVKVEALPKEYLTLDNETHFVTSIDFAGLIGEKAVEFAEKKLGVSNVMCEYDLWTSQSAAVTEIGKRSYFAKDDSQPDGHKLIRYSENEEYHTDYLGKPHDHPNYQGQADSKDERWVNYYDLSGNDMPENRLTEDLKCVDVEKIVVWCYNYPKQYDVDIYGANSEDDLVSKTVAGNQVFVAKADSTDSFVKRIDENGFYYNQRFGGATDKGDQDDPGFIGNYGLKAYTNVKPADYAEEKIDGTEDGETVENAYTFAYWAYDQEGTQVASVERDFWYRVSVDTKLYAVYTKAGASAAGISISANANDTFVDNSGVSKTRLNILASVYGVPVYDKNVEKLSFVNISLSEQIRSRPDIYTPEKIDALFVQYQEQLKDIIEDYDKNYGSKSFTTEQLFDGAVVETTDETTGETTVEISDQLQLTLTAKGYIYTVTSNGNTAAQGDSTVKLTNKNRAQFTISYKTSALNVNHTGTKGDTCLMYCGALKYNGEWKISTNCLIYYNGEAVKNTADHWE